MKHILTTIAACALLPLGALAQNSFPAPPPDLSVSTEGPDFFIGTGPEFGFAVADEPDVFFLAQNTTPAPPQGGGNAVYMTQGPGGPGGPGGHFQMHTMGPHKWWKDSETVKQLQLSDAQATQIEQAFTDFFALQARANQPRAGADQSGTDGTSSEDSMVVAAGASL